MKLIDDWRRVAPKLWSVRLALAAAAFGALEVGVTWWVSGKPPVMALVATIASLAAGAARVVAQPGLMDK